MKRVDITYYGHACFMLDADGYRIVIDPYKDGMVDGLPNLSLEAETVFASHGHADHNYCQAVTVRETDRPAPYTMESIEASHDDQGGKLRGKNTVRIFDFDGLKVAHLGDLGHLPEGELLKKLRGVDCLLIPTGGTYTIDHVQAKQTVDLVQPKVVIPMHYRTDRAGFEVLTHLNDFTQQYKEVNSCENTFALTSKTEKQVLVINYKP